MALDTTAPKTRRAVLAGACGGAALLAVSTLGRPEAVRALDPNDVVLGAENTSDGMTTFHVDSESLAAVSGVNALGEGVRGSTGGTGRSGVSGTSTGGGFGVMGIGNGPDGTGVYGMTDSTSGGATGVLGASSSPEGSGVIGSCDATTGNNYGVQGSSASSGGTGVSGTTSAATGGTGVYGASDGADGTGVAGYGHYGVWGDSSYCAVFGHVGSMTGVLGFAGVIDMGVPPPAPVAKTGVFGYCAIDSAAVGVLGRTTAGKGVRGDATTGTGGYFASTSGYALDVAGKARFSRSKRVTVAAGTSSLRVTLPGVTTSSLVFANLQTNRTGYSVQAIVPTTGAFTIYLNRTLTSATYVAYFVVN